MERAIGYARQSFWPLRDFIDVHDVNRQARQWLTEVANQRLHRETRQRPIDRFKADALRSLPVIPYAYRDTVDGSLYRGYFASPDGCRRMWAESMAGRFGRFDSERSLILLRDGMVCGDVMTSQTLPGEAVPGAFTSSGTRKPPS